MKEGFSLNNTNQLKDNESAITVNYMVGNTLCSVTATYPAFQLHRIEPAKYSEYYKPEHNKCYEKLKFVQ